MGAVILGAGPSPGNVAAMPAGRYYRAPNATLTAANTFGIGSLRLVPKFVPNPVALTRIGAEVTIIGDAGSLVRLGIYGTAAGDFRPGPLVLDAGTILGDSATVQEIVIAQALAAGWYWFGGAVQNTVTVQPTTRNIAIPEEPCPTDYGVVIPTANMNAFGFNMVGVTGALPATFVVGAASGAALSVFVKT